MTSASELIIASLFLENNCYEQYSQIQFPLFYFIRDCEPKFKIKIQWKHPR